MPPISEWRDAAASGPDRVLRHRSTDRLIHWTIAACMLALLATSLLPIFGVKFDWVGPHWIVGLILTAAVLVHVLRAFTIFTLRDMWLGFAELKKSVSAELSVVGGNYVKSAKPGKYSVAQKMFHLMMTAVVLLAIGTGIVMMVGIDTPFWERNPLFVSESTRGGIFVLHGLAALVSISMIIVHIYFAVRPEKLYFLRSMVRGWITRVDYEENHDPILWKRGDQ